MTGIMTLSSRLPDSLKTCSRTLGPLWAAH